MSEFSPIYPPSKTPWIWESLFWRKISPFQALFPFCIFQPLPEKPVKCLFSVRVENTHKYRPVCRNTTDLHLTWWLVRPFKSRCISPLSVPHPGPGKAARTRIWGSFFPRELVKKLLCGNHVIEEESALVDERSKLFWPAGALLQQAGGGRNRAPERHPVFLSSLHERSARFPTPCKKLFWGWFSTHVFNTGQFVDEYLIRRDE